MGGGGSIGRFTLNLPILSSLAVSCFASQKVFSYERPKKETEAKLPRSLTQSITFHKVKVTPEKVRGILKLLGMDFSEFDKGKCSQK